MHIIGAGSFRKTGPSFPDHALYSAGPLAYRETAKSPTPDAFERSGTRSMSSNIDTLVTIFGGSGFVGRHVVRALAKREYRIRVAVRRPELAGHLQPLGRVGQINIVQANLRHPASIKAAMRDASIVVNLVGILTES